jgi:carbonic anhydrase
MYSSDWKDDCLGKFQSPINIEDSIDVRLSLKFNYKREYQLPKDNGHAIQVDVKNKHTIFFGKDEYELKQFHFHSPSEEIMFGKNRNLSIHFVHKNSKNQLTVVAVTAVLGEHNKSIDLLFSDEPIDLSLLLPDVRSFYTYMGSLTTPPCTEGVLWIVMANSISISKQQLDVYFSKYKNARPKQSKNRRFVLFSPNL